MDIVSTHPVGSCDQCDTLRHTLRNVTEESTARYAHGSACIAFATNKEKSS